MLMKPSVANGHICYIQALEAAGLMSQASQASEKYFKRFPKGRMELKKALEQCVWCVVCGVGVWCACVVWVCNVGVWCVVCNVGVWCDVGVWCVGVWCGEGVYMCACVMLILCDILNYLM